MNEGGWRRRRSLRRVMAIIGMLAVSAPTLIVGQNVSDKQPQIAAEGERQLEEGRSTLDQKTLLAAKEAFDNCVAQASQNARCYYDRARTEYYLARERDMQKDKKGTERWIDSAVSDAQRAIALNERSADAHALLGDLYGQKISGMMAGMKYGPKANAETARAFELDPNNAQAFAVVGRKYYFAPSMFGGDLNKAIESFKKATMLDPHYDEAFVWLAIAYRKKGDTQDAQAALAEALRLNSRSTFAKRIQAGASL